MRKIISIMLVMIMMVIPVLPEASYGVEGHIEGCPNAGSYDLSCCTRTFNIAAKEGYEVVDVMVNGVSQGVISSYTFTNMTGKETLKVITREVERIIISYNANGGSGEPVNQEKLPGVELTLSSTIPIRAGYSFIGWNTEADGSGTAYAAGEGYEEDAGLRLYAQWQVIEVGSYIAYTPSSTSYTVSAEASGHTSAQTYNPSTYSGGWKVFKNNNGQLDIISAESIGNLTLNGATGYTKAVNTLNNLSSAYINPTYASGARSLGYGGALGDISSESLNYGVSGSIYDDITYTSDSIIIDANTSLRHSEDEWVWLASRHLNTYSNCSYFALNRLHSNGVVRPRGMLWAYTNSVSTETTTCGVRPVVSLKSGVRISGGSGTQANPYTILYTVWEEDNSIPLSSIDVGSYIAYTPSSTSYTVPTTESGHTSAQTYNPSTYSGGWKVFKNNNEQLDIISAESIGNLTLSGETGYRKAVKTLNCLCNEYVNSKYASGGRSLGYGGTAGEIYSTYELNYGVSGLPYNDTTFISDNSIINSNTSLRHSGGEWVWLASRHLSTNVDRSYFAMHRLYSSGAIGYNGLLFVYTNSVSPGTGTNGVRPVVSLKYGVRITGGSGTQADPYRISI